MGNVIQFDNGKVVNIEQWRPIAGFEGLYEVSNLGRVRSLPRRVRCEGNGYRTQSGRIMRLRVLDGGYIGLILTSHEGVASTFLVHRLVAEAFIPNPANKPEVHHKDNVRTHNRASNLAWLTKAEHEALTLVQRPRGTKHWHAMVTEAQVIEMRKLRAEGWPLRDLGIRFDVTNQTACQIVTRKTWKHI